MVFKQKKLKNLNGTQEPPPPSRKIPLKSSILFFGIPPLLFLLTIPRREVTYDRDMLGSIQGARPEQGFSLGGMQVHAKEQGLEQAMQGLVLSQVRLSVILSSFILTCSQHQQPSLLPSSVMAHNLPCLDSLASQVNGVPSNIFQLFRIFRSQIWSWLMRYQAMQTHKKRWRPQATPPIANTWLTELTRRGRRRRCRPA